MSGPRPTKVMPPSDFATQLFATGTTDPAAIALKMYDKGYTIEEAEMVLSGKGFHVQVQYPDRGEPVFAASSKKFEQDAEIPGSFRWKAVPHKS